MPNENATHWDIEIRGRPGRPDPTSVQAAEAVGSLRDSLRTRFQTEAPTPTGSRGYLVESSSPASEIERAARHLLIDRVVEEATVITWADAELDEQTLTVLRRPGVMDPAAETAENALTEFGLQNVRVRPFHRYRFEASAPRPVLSWVAEKSLANLAVDQIVFGAWKPEHLTLVGEYQFKRLLIPIRGLSADALEEVSQASGLSLNREEMSAVQQHFHSLDREPTDVELETIAQTWSEHCSHKTLRGPYSINGEVSTNGLLKDTIFHATRHLAKEWCASVFSDNAGIIHFDDHWNVCFKVETHNRPSAIEPYGGANTGLGGVVRDILGAGLGAKPICNTNVFCTAPPDTPTKDLLEGVLHPARVLRGVVAGVRDYGNRMGIPTVNGAVVCDPRYLGNPLVFCGSVGLIPRQHTFGSASAGEWIVSVGGRSGRDGIHGATFSSGVLTEESEKTSGGAVQIGNAIAEKKVAEAVLRARDLGLFTAITDCGAGGFSSAVGEMGADLGANVDLNSAPLKYAGLSYTEIWISEAQERMVLSVPDEKWAALELLCREEGVEATRLGHFEATGKLKLNYNGTEVCNLDMHFLHEGRPAVLRTGVWNAPAAKPFAVATEARGHGDSLHQLLASWNIASKEWIIRQYDHEVQGGSVVKPLVGVGEGPGDAAVIRPLLDSMKAIAIGCGLQIGFGDLDPYRMAAAAIDEAIRNVVAVGGDPAHTAILDNFCWGDVKRPETFGSLCLAAQSCKDTALAFETPFISGKDSLNNEFTSGDRRIVIPPTLLISALAIVPDARFAMTMDVKEAGNLLIVVGNTASEMGGSQYNNVLGGQGGEVPTVAAVRAAAQYRRIHELAKRGKIRACHDASEGGLAVALAEMAFAGMMGIDVDLALAPGAERLSEIETLFSESCSRLILEITPQQRAEVNAVMSDSPYAVVGKVVAEPIVVIRHNARELIRESAESLRESWRRPFAW